jgi:arogenate/prephenate dehydratase
MPSPPQPPPSLQALAQCDGFIRKMGYSRTPTDDTATASQLVSTKKLANTGAISSSRAAELYGLEILQSGIQDVENNVTRFVVLSR